MFVIMKEIYKFIVSDYHRYYGGDERMGGGKLIKILTIALSAKNHCFAYSFWLRLASKPNPLYYVAKWMHYRLSRKYGIQISPSMKLGYGLYIGHGVAIVINPGTIIGNNCNISQCLTIGTNHNTPAVIGDNVYIGPGVCIVEDVRIGNNVTIGAGSVVVKDLPDNATVAGVPAKVLNYNNPGKYITNKYCVNS